MSVHIKTRLRNKLDRVCIPLKVWHQSLDQEPPFCSLLQLLDCGCDMCSSSVKEVIPVYTGQYHVVYAPCCHSLHITLAGKTVALQ